MNTINPKLALVNENDAATILGWSVKTLQRRRWLREQPPFLKVGRSVRYRISDLELFLDACTIHPERG